MRRLSGCLLFSLLLAIGCTGTAEPELEPATDGVLPLGAAKADGRSYFEQFRYDIDEAAGTYDSGEPRATFMATNWDDRVYLESEAGGVWTDLDVWLLDGGVAYVEYEEWRGNELAEGRIIRTTWSEAEDVLSLPGVGAGVAGTDSGRPSIDVTFEADLISPGLTGQTLSVIRVRTSSRIQHVERDFAEQEG